MKKYLFLAVVLFSFIGMHAETKTVVFEVNPPLVCNNCETKVKENIRFEKGVKTVKPSAEKGVIEISYDDTKTDVEKLQKGLKKIGYEATVAPAEEQTSINDCVSPQSATCSGTCTGGSCTAQ